MALRKILTEGDEQLLKHSRKVEKFDDRLHTLIDARELRRRWSGRTAGGNPAPRCRAAGCEQGTRGNGRAGKSGSHREEGLGACC